jgi:hypothetical protein
MATKFVVESAKKELMAPEWATQSKPSSPVKSNTPARRKSSGANTALRIRGNHRRSSGNMEEDMEPELQLAKALGISLPAEGVPESTRAEVLEKMLLERVGRLEGHATNLQSATETSIASHLLDAHMALEMLHESLLAESLYGKVHLLDPTTEESVGSFEHDLQAVQKSLEAVDLYSLQSKNFHREQFIQRWAR